MKAIGTKSQSIAEGLKNSFNSKSDAAVLLDSGSPCPNGTPGSNCILLGDSLSIVDLISQCSKQGFRHVIQNTSTNYLREISLSLELIESPQNALKNFSEFILGPSMSKTVAEVNFVSTADKDPTMNAVLKHLAAIKGTNLLGDSAHLISDEMFTNAIFNAPPVGAKEELAGRLRGKAFTIDSNSPAKFHIAHNETRVMIACEDPFGTLRESDLLKSLQPPESDDGLINVKQGPGGAGIGTRLIFNYCTEFYVLCKKGKQTVFACTLPLHQSEKEQALTPKNFHVVFF